ncbi:MAG: hypothetical protein ACOC8H_01945 [bacterium]
MSDDLGDAIKQNADGPARAEVDGQSVSQHRLRDQIEADRYLKSKQAMKGGKGLRIAKLVPPGAT